MYRYRGFILASALCFALEAPIVLSLYALGATVMFTTTIVTIWICVSCVVTITVGEHFEKKSGHRGD
ncbi:MAG TPA: hypothetical protein VMF55_05070 [Solirubrobacterales bacterium]|nr:hypothetical protein [Solirubrobacterales bacterium]